MNVTMVSTSTRTFLNWLCLSTLNRMKFTVGEYAMESVYYMYTICIVYAILYKSVKYCGLFLYYESLFLIIFNGLQYFLNILNLLLWNVLSIFKGSVLYYPRFCKPPTNNQEFTVFHYLTFSHRPLKIRLQGGRGPRTRGWRPPPYTVVSYKTLAMQSNLCFILLSAIYLVK